MEHPLWPPLRDHEAVQEPARFNACGGTDVPSRAGIQSAHAGPARSSPARSASTQRASSHSKSDNRFR